MHLHTPYLVLVPDTFLSAKDASLLTAGKRASSTSLLVELIRDEFPGAHIEPIGRKYWNETAGMIYLYLPSRVVSHKHAIRYGVYPAALRPGRRTRWYYLGCYEKVSIYYALDSLVSRNAGTTRCQPLQLFLSTLKEGSIFASLPVH